MGVSINNGAKVSSGRTRFVDRNSFRNSTLWPEEERNSPWALANPITVTATGGTVTDITDGGTNYRVHTFTSNGTFEVTEGGEIEYLVVAGGGGDGAIDGFSAPPGTGGQGGGGGGHGGNANFGGGDGGSGIVIIRYQI